MHSDIEACQPPVDHAAGTADTRIHRDGLDRAVKGTGAAFHTGVQVGNNRFAATHFKYPVGADRGAYPAADTDRLIELECSNTRKIVKSLHDENTPTSSTSTPATAAESITGSEKRISLRTPDGEVNGVLPVKFMA